MSVAVKTQAETRHTTDLGPFRAIRWTSLERIGMRDPDFGWTAEMQVKALRAGLRVVEVPVSYRRRVGVSKITGTVSGTVRAAVTGTPLSAAVTVLDLPLPPVQTDPATGAYTLDLPQGQHRLKASASPYYWQQRLIQLEADSRQDFSLFLQQDFFLPQVQCSFGNTR